MFSFSSVTCSGDHKPGFTGGQSQGVGTVQIDDVRGQEGS